MKCPVIVWATGFYILTLAGLVIPSFFLHRPDHPTPENPTEKQGLFASEGELSSRQSLQMYLLFMIPLMSALNGAFLYLIHYRHVRWQQYRVEINEGDNLMFSIAARSLFSDRKLRKMLRSSKIEPLVLYEGYNGIVPVIPSACTTNAAVGGATTRNLANSTFGINIGLSQTAEAGALAGGANSMACANSSFIFDSSIMNMNGGHLRVGGGGLTNNTFTGAMNEAMQMHVNRDWHTVDTSSAPSRLLRRLRGRFRPQGVTGHGPDSLRCAFFAGSDVSALVAIAQEINEVSASVRYEISKRYADVLEDTDLIQAAVQQMNEQKLKRLRKARARSLGIREVDEEGTPAPQPLAVTSSDNGNAVASPLANTHPASARDVSRPHGGGSTPSSQHNRRASVQNINLLQNPFGAFVDTFYMMSPKAQLSGGAAEREKAPVFSRRQSYDAPPPMSHDTAEGAPQSKQRESNPRPPANGPTSANTNTNNDTTNTTNTNNNREPFNERPHSAPSPTPQHPRYSSRHPQIHQKQQSIDASSAFVAATAQIDANANDDAVSASTGATKGVGGSDHGPDGHAGSHHSITPTKQTMASVGREESNSSIATWMRDQQEHGVHSATKITHPSTRASKRR